MTKGTQLWPGEKMRTFFLAHIRRQTSLDEAGAEKLAEALTRAVNRMLVWEMPPPVPVESTPDDSKKSFNPFAFSATVIFAKKGPAGLMQRLSEIESVENLRAMALAQHLAVDGDLTDADDLRDAIVAAAERRLADRKAAAS